MPDTIPAPASTVTEDDIKDDRPTLAGGGGYEDWVRAQERKHEREQRHGHE